MLQTAILKGLEQLPESLQREVLHFIEFLLARYVKPAVSEEPAPRKKRRAGVMKGKVIMADDFDAPLDEFQDYM
ncbi:MAG: DUF2281 domain-containing protein [Microcoleus sp. SU_5_6]|nr:DUF2281 domain-containing protein [Microcoleus sp. SU_5_6]NJL66428.1 DUF2281 domain-containing protein [Microcoleus sp. SM1_3_4]